MNQCNINGSSLNFLASGVAAVLSQGLSDNEIALLGAFFTVLGDSLSTIAAANTLASSNQ